MMRVPDDIDLKILKVLQDNARLDAAEVARRVNLSRTPVSTRIKALEAAGYIKRYVSVLDRERLGRPVLVIMHVRLENQSTALLDEFEQLALTIPEVQSLLHVSGVWNFILHISAVSPQEYFRCIMDKINNLENVKHVESSFVLKECKSYGPMPLPADVLPVLVPPKSNSV